MRTSDWSSDVCSSDLARGRRSSGHSSCNACRTGKTAGTKHPHAEEEVGSDVELGGKGGCNPVTAQSGVVSWPSPTRMVLYGPILRPGGKGRNLRAMWAAGPALSFRDRKFRHGVEPFGRLRMHQALRAQNRKRTSMKTSTYCATNI